MSGGLDDILKRGAYLNPNINYFPPSCCQEHNRTLNNSCYLISGVTNKQQCTFKLHNQQSHAVPQASTIITISKTKHPFNIIKLVSKQINRVETKVNNNKTNSKMKSNYGNSDSNSNNSRNNPNNPFKLENNQRKQKHEEQEDENSNSNLSAQRAAVEAISISQSSLTATMIQGEQLNHCNNLRMRNEYIVNKSERLIRGMTWSGWMKNLVSRDIEPPKFKKSMSMLPSYDRNRNNNSNDSNKDNNCNNNNNNQEMKLKHSIMAEMEESTNEFKDVPTQLLNQVSLVTNYNSNVLLLKQCQSVNDYEVCLDICNTLKIATEESLKQIQMKTQPQEYQFHGGDDSGSGSDSGSNSATIKEWEEKLNTKFQKTKQLHSFMSQELNSEFYNKTSFTSSASASASATSTTSNRNSHKNNHNQNYNSSMKSNIISNMIMNTSMKSNNPKIESKYQEQEDHLNMLSNNVEELLHNSASINMSLGEQNLILDELNDGTDDLVESTKMVSRKADRIRYRSVRTSMILFFYVFLFFMYVFFSIAIVLIL
jgi:hypothetical protein